MPSISEKEYKIIRGVAKAMSLKYRSRHHMACRSDLYSAAIEEIVKSIGRFNWKKGNFRHYVTLCAQRGVKEYLRKISGSEKSPKRVHPVDFSEDDTPFLAAEDDPYDDVIGFPDLVSVLPEREHVIIFLYYRWNFTLDEIAECFGMTGSRISQLMKSSRETIRCSYNGELLELRESILEREALRQDWPA